MTWRLSERPDAIGVASARVGEVRGIPAAHVEKDFWVTEVLRAAVNQATKEGVTLVFKGGTSLSKAHSIIQRFSEDVDLIVVAPTYSKQAADRCLKNIGAAVGVALGVEGVVDKDTATTGRLSGQIAIVRTTEIADALLGPPRLDDDSEPCTDCQRNQRDQVAPRILLAERGHINTINPWSTRRGRSTAELLDVPPIQP